MPLNVQCGIVRERGSLDHLRLLQPSGDQIAGVGSRKRGGLILRDGRVSAIAFSSLANRPLGRLLAETTPARCSFLDPRSTSVCSTGSKAARAAYLAAWLDWAWSKPRHHHAAGGRRRGSVASDIDRRKKLRQAWRKAYRPKDVPPRATAPGSHAVRWRLQNNCPQVITHHGNHAAEDHHGSGDVEPGMYHGAVKSRW